jgi:hypothetical protein
LPIKEVDVMKTIEMAYGISLLVAVILVTCVVYAWYRFVETTISSIPYAMFTAVGIVICASLALVIAGAAVYSVRWMSYRSRYIFAKDGIYPYVYDGGYVNLNEHVPRASQH